MAKVTLKNVYKFYPGERGKEITAVEDFSLEVMDREFVVFVGPSGCGKSTTLRMIAGLEEISKGDVLIGDKRVNDLPPKDRDIAMVFQNYALYPHMSVYENMAFGLELRKFPKAEIKKRVLEAAAILGIEQFLNRRPKALSGGQRQRVAVGRAIVRQPEVFLFDEPLSNLDAKMRVQMRTELAKLHQRLQATMIYVTHDQIEAMTMGTRIVVMKDGLIQQVDIPLRIYSEPKNLFVAGFLGSPPMNLLKGVRSTAARALSFFVKHKAVPSKSCSATEKLQRPSERTSSLVFDPRIATLFPRDNPLPTTVSKRWWMSLSRWAQKPTFICTRARTRLSAAARRCAADRRWTPVHLSD